MSQVDSVGVLGAGLMGAGIAQVAAVAGYRTVCRDVSQDALAKAQASIAKSLARFVEKGNLNAADRDAALRHLTFTDDLDAVAHTSLVIEAVTEDLAVKNTLFTDLNVRSPHRTVFASNTSSLTIGAMAVASNRPDRFVGLHFFNPVPLMPLVEVVRGVTTSESTMSAAMEFVQRLGKVPIEARDTSGFIVNLLLVPYLLDAVRALERGAGTVTDIDRGMKLGCGYPMGPFTLLDFVGLDTTMRIGEIMFEEYRETRYAPPPLLKRMVLAGWLGRKSGRGFYDYSQDPPRAMG